MAYDSVITRFKRNMHGLFSMHRGARVVEVLLIRRRADGKWAIPGSFKEGVPVPITKAFGVEQGSDRYTYLSDVIRQLQYRLDEVRRQAMSGKEANIISLAHVQEITVNDHSSCRGYINTNINDYICTCICIEEIFFSLL